MALVHQSKKQVDPIIQNIKLVVEVESLFNKQSIYEALSMLVDSSIENLKAKNLEKASLAICRATYLLYLRYGNHSAIWFEFSHILESIKWALDVSAYAVALEELSNLQVFLNDSGYLDDDFEAPEFINSTNAPVAIFEVNWGNDINVSLEVSKTHWKLLQKHKNISIRGPGYHSDGEYYFSRWNFENGIHGFLEVTYGSSRRSDSEGVGYIGKAIDMLSMPPVPIHPVEEQNSILHRNILKQNSRSINGLQLSFEYFGAGPGSGGISDCRIIWTKVKKEIRIRGDRFAQPSDVVIIRAPLNSNWRSICRAIIKRSAYAFFSDGDTSGEYAWPDRMHCNKPHSFQTTLIAMAWAGPPFSELCLQLLELPDRNLRNITNILNIWNRHGARKALKYFELLKTRKELFKILLQEKLTPEMSISELSKIGFDIAREKLITEKRIAANRQEKLSPFVDDIKIFLANWKKQNPARSWAEGMGQGAKLFSIKGYIENYIIEHGHLPKGKHRINSTIENFKFSIEFNIDDLGTG